MATRGILIAEVGHWRYRYRFDLKDWEKYKYWWESNQDSCGERRVIFTMSAIPNRDLEEAHERLEKENVVNLAIVRKGTNDNTVSGDWLIKLDLNTVVQVRINTIYTNGLSSLSSSYSISSSSNSYYIYTIVVVDKDTTTNIVRLYIEEEDKYINVHSISFSNIYLLAKVLGKQSDKVSLSFDDPTAAEGGVKEVPNE